VWDEARVRWLMDRTKISKEAREEITGKHNNVYLSNLRRAVYRRLLGFHDLEQLAKKFRVALDDLEQVVRIIFLPSMLSVRRKAYFRALNAAEYGPIEPVHSYSALVAEVASKVLERSALRRRTQFIVKYDTSLEEEDLVHEVTLKVINAVQQEVGLVPTEKLIRFASRTAKNATSNILKFYTSQKRARLRRSDDPTREYEATTVSIVSPEAIEHLAGTCELELFADPVLIASAQKELKKRKYTWRKRRFLDLLSQGYSWDVAAAMVGLSKASQAQVKDLLLSLVEADQCKEEERLRLQARIGVKFAARHTS